MSQQIRPSQFVTTYGPGAIVETAEGPGVVPALDKFGLFDRNDPDEFEIRGSRLVGLLPPGSRVVAIPSNAELKQPEDRVPGRLFGFPDWSLCPDHNILYRAYEVCPKCRAKRGRQQAIRFVMACPAGHLDDVNWPSLIKHKASCSRPNWLQWRGSGALSNVRIACPTCTESVSLGDLYNRSMSCSGRSPEEGRSRAGCIEHAQMTQRGAANLRVAEVVSALTIPPRDTELHLLLNKRVINQALKVSRAKTKADLEAALGLIADDVSPEDLVVLGSYSAEQVAEAITAVIDYEPPEDQAGLLEEELAALREGASHGAPPVGAPDGRGEHQFEMPRSGAAEFSTPIGRVRVASVTRLRVVLAQRGFRRVDPAVGARVDSGATIGGRLWYPGVEVFGEAVFVMLAETRDLDPSALARVSPLTGFDPRHIWWHTLSHRILRVIGRDAGYSTAAIRERVYAGAALSDGGLLFYTAQPGGDGTLGGLAALSRVFGDVISQSVEDVSFCSNDPLCGDRQLASTDVNGAACYACSFVSETSCEHRNTGLDRMILSMMLA